MTHEPIWVVVGGSTPYEIGDVVTIYGPLYPEEAA